MKNKHRIKQGLSLLLAGGIALTNLGAALPAFAEDAAATPETAQMATLDPDAAVLYTDLPDAPTGSYIGSEGLPVATGQTKISLSLWADGQLEQDSHLDPDALNSGDKTVTVPLTEDTDYAIVPLMAQVEYPADGSRTDVLLPENVTLLDYYGEPAQDTTVLHSEYAETSAAATGLYLLTDGDFTAQLVYTAPDGNSLTQNLNVVIDRSSTAAPPFADMGVAPYAGRPTPAVTSGRITKVAKVNATWLIWFTVTPSRTGGSVDSGSWQMTPAGAQTITTSGHTQDDTYIITKNARSEYIPELQIIDQETFEKANDIISRRSAKTAQDRRIAHTSQNPTLLAGIVYCAHCGAKMSGFMHTDRYKLADGSIREKVQPKYNCFQRGQRNKGGRDCDGQALYLAERVDAIVLKIVEEVFEQIRDTPYSQVAENRIRQESNLQKTKRAAAEKKIKAAQHALERFEGEILKCLDGTSNFTEDMIAKQIRRYQQELDDAKAEYAELQNARLNEAAEIRKLRTYYDDFKGWAEEFDTAPLEMKRMILSHLIDRVEVGRKYQVIVKFNMKYRQFLECTAETYNTEIGA